MATNAYWLNLAKKLYSTTFKGQTNNTVILTQVESNYQTQSNDIIATDTINPARVYGFKLSQILGNVQQGDRQIGIINENLSVNPRADNVECTVNGVPVIIKDVGIDEAGAIYTLHVRNK